MTWTARSLPAATLTFGEVRVSRMRCGCSGWKRPAPAVGVADGLGLAVAVGVADGEVDGLGEALGGGIVEAAVLTRAMSVMSLSVPAAAVAAPETAS